MPEDEEKKPRYLCGLRVSKIGLVSGPANFRDFLIFKSADGKETVMFEKLKGILQKFGVTDVEAAATELENALAAGEPVKPVEKAEGEAKKVEPEAGPVEKKAVGDLQEVIKQQAETIKQQRTLLDAITAKVNELTASRDQQELERKAATFDALPIEKAALVNILKQGQDNKDFMDALTTLNNAFAKSELFVSRGSASDGGSAGLSAKIESIVKASNGKTSFEEATRQAIKENPALYDEYVKEMHAAQRGMPNEK